MHINRSFHVRRDLEEWMFFFSDGDTLEMPTMPAIITELLRVDRSRRQLVQWVSDLFPESDAEREVDDVLTVYRELRMLAE